MSSQQQTPESESTGLLDLIDHRVFWKRKWSLAFCILVTVGLGTAFITREKPIYEVTSRMLVQLERFGTEKDSLLRTDRTFLVTQGELLRCPVVVESALNSLRKANEPPVTYSQTEAVTNLLRIAVVDDANVLKLTYRNTDPEYAVAVLRAIMESYQVYIKDMQHGSLQETLQVLAQHEQELRKEVERLEERYYQLRKGSRLIGQGGDAFRSYAAMLDRIATRLTEARSQRIDKEIQVRSIANARGIAPLQLTSGPPNPKTVEIPSEEGDDSESELTEVPVTATVVLPTPTDTVFGSDPFLRNLTDPGKIQLQLWQAETHAKQTSQIFGPSHPTRRAAEAEIVMWKHRLEECEKATPMILNQELASLKEIEEHLTLEHETEFSKVKALDASLLQEQQCLADIERVQSIHKATADQLRQLELADETHTNGEVAVMVRLIEPPDASSKLVWPRPMQFISLCAIMGVALGCVFVTVVDRVTRKAR